MIRSLTWMLLMTPLSLHAQKPAESVTTHILTFAPASLPEAFLPYYRKAGAAAPFVASVGTLGLPIPYTGPRVFDLYGSKDNLEKSKTPVASATLPEKCDLVLVICTRAPEDKISLAAYNLDSGDLKPGDYRIFNFSKSLISLTLDGQNVELPAGKDTYVRDAKWHDQPTAFPLQISTITEGKSKRAYSSYWEHYPTRRNLLFLFDGDHPSRPINLTSFDAETVPQNNAPGGTSKRPKP